MNLQSVGLSSGAMDARIQRAIELSRPNARSFSDELRVGVAKTSPNTAAADGVKATHLAAKTEEINWGAVSLNLGAVNGNVVYTTDITRVADLAMSSASAKLEAAFAQAGIPSSPPVDFRFTMDGQLAVDDHPRKRDIEALLAEQPALARDVREAFVLKENAVSWEKASLYTQAQRNAFAAGGQAAADALTSLYIGLGNATPTLRMGSSGLEALFNGQSQDNYLASIAARLGMKGRIDLLA